MSEPMRVGVMEEARPVPEEPAVDSTPQPEAEAPKPEPVEVKEGDESPIKPEDELWPGGPTMAMIDAWKKEFGDVYVTSVTPDTHYVWRTLTRFEYRRLVKNLEQAVSTGQVTQAEANMNNEEAMAEICLLFPPVSRVELSSNLAGLASIISQEVMEASGFVALEIRQL